jgi:hypothetical protein
VTIRHFVEQCGQIAAIAHPTTNESWIASRLRITTAAILIDLFLLAGGGTILCQMAALRLHPDEVVLVPITREGGTDRPKGPVEAGAEEETAHLGTTTVRPRAVAGAAEENADLGTTTGHPRAVEGVAEENVDLGTMTGHPHVVAGVAERDAANLTDMIARRRLLEVMKVATGRLEEMMNSEAGPIYAPLKRLDTYTSTALPPY